MASKGTSRRSGAQTTCDEVAALHGETHCSRAGEGPSGFFDFLLKA